MKVRRNILMGLPADTEVVFIRDGGEDKFKNGDKGMKLGNHADHPLVLVEYTNAAGKSVKEFIATEMLTCMALEVTMRLFGNDSNKDPRFRNDLIK